MLPIEYEAQYNATRKTQHNKATHAMPHETQPMPPIPHMQLYGCLCLQLYG